MESLKQTTEIDDDYMDPGMQIKTEGNTDDQDYSNHHQYKDQMKSVK